MTEKEKLEVIKHSYEVLQGLVKDLTERVNDAQEGIATSDQNLIMGSLYGLFVRAPRRCPTYQSNRIGQIAATDVPYPCFSKQPLR